MIMDEQRQRLMIEGVVLFMVGIVDEKRKR